MLPQTSRTSRFSSQRSSPRPFAHEAGFTGITPGMYSKFLPSRRRRGSVSPDQQVWVWDPFPFLRVFDAPTLPKRNHSPQAIYSLYYTYKTSYTFLRIKVIPEGKYAPSPSIKKDFHPAIPTEPALSFKMCRIRPQDRQNKNKNI